MNTARRKSERTPRKKATAAIALTAALTAIITTLFVPLSGSAQPQTAPVNTTPPTISGTQAKGATLTASPGTWTGTPPINFVYQWLRCNDDGADCDSIAAATKQTYVLDETDVGDRIRVRATAANADGSSNALSAATDEIAAGGTPRNQGEPRTSGSPVEGQKLTATNGTWTGDQPLTYAYQWVRCGIGGGLPDGSNCAVIPRASSSTYVLTSAEVGTRIRVRVTAKNASGSTTATSNATQLVRAGKAAINTKRPSVSGSMVEGVTVSVNPGTWTGAQPIAFTYQWLRCDGGGGSCAAISGATGTQYRLTSADIARKIRVNVTARNSGGNATIMSTESATVAPAGPAGVIVLPSGERSIPATSVSSTERLLVTEVRFSPNPVRSRTAPINIRVRVKDTRGLVVRDALVFVRSTPLVTRGENRLRTGADGWVDYTVVPRFTFPQPRSGYNVQFFVKAYRAGDNPLAGVAGYRLVQVRLAR